MADQAARVETQVRENMDLLLTFLKAFGGRIVAAILVLVVGVLIGRWIGRMLMRTLEKRHLEPPLRMLIVRIAKVIVFAFALVVAVQNLGVEVLPLVAGIGVAGVGVGLAMQGVLSNLVAGLTIIFTRPFRVGEYVELLGVHGLVREIELFSTRLTHPDRSVVIIPNRKIVGEILHNYGTIRQLNLQIPLAYRANLNEALTIVRTVLLQNARVLKDPEPIVGVSDLADWAITLAIKPWVAVADYGASQAEIYQTVLERFRASGIDIPLPQREVRVISPDAGRAAAG